MPVKIDVNGCEYSLDVDPDTPLLWVLRDHLGLMGTKYGCGVGECGACTVLLDGKADRSCVMPVSKAAGSKIVTIEGLNTDIGRSLIDAWVAEDVPQCGYCQPGMIMSAAALLEGNPHPDNDEVDKAMTNICRCGTYHRVRKAIRRAVGDER